mmetsp:Transcript_23576/g.38902  ORF Transcript_23576/g.38902 Transcript_23576/m.38902 type:complete len:142 (-) Transcript_23576:1382-1807(-)
MLPLFATSTQMLEEHFTTKTTNYLQITHYHIHDYYNHIRLSGFDIFETIFAFMAPITIRVYGREARLGWAMLRGNLRYCEFVFLSSTSLVTGCWVCVYRIIWAGGWYMRVVFRMLYRLSGWGGNLLCKKPISDASSYCEIL